MNDRAGRGRQVEGPVGLGARPLASAEGASPKEAALLRAVRQRAADRRQGGSFRGLDRRRTGRGPQCGPGPERPDSVKRKPAGAAPRGSRRETLSTAEERTAEPHVPCGGRGTSPRGPAGRPVRAAALNHVLSADDAAPAGRSRPLGFRGRSASGTGRLRGRGRHHGGLAWEPALLPIRGPSPRSSRRSAVSHQVSDF